MLALGGSALGRPALGQTFPTPALAPAPAPVAASGAPTPEADISASIDEIDETMRALSHSARAPQLSDDQIKAKLAAIPPLQSKLSDIVATLTPRLANVDARLAQLGPAPAAGQPAEDPDLAKNRRNTTHFRAQLDSDLKQAKLLQVEATQLAATLTARQQQQQTARLWAHSRSMLDPGLWREFAGAAPKDFQRLLSLLVDENNVAADALRSPAVATTLALTAILALGVAVPLRIVLNLLAYRRVVKLSPGTRLRRTLLALWLIAVGALTPWIALSTLRAGLGGVGAVTPAFDDLAPLLTRVVVFAAFFEAMGRALLSPGRPSWRLAPIPDAVVRRLAPYPLLIGVSAALANLIRGLNNVVGASAPTTITSDGVTVLLELLAVGGALGALGQARSEHLAQAVEDTSHHQAESRLPWIVAALLAWLTLGASLLAVLTGYLELAATLMSRMIWVATVLAALFLLLRLADDVYPTVLSPERPVGRFLQIAIGLSRHALEQISVLASGATRLALLLFGWAAILAPFGSGASDLLGRLTSSQLVIHIGQVSIPPGAILGAIAVFLLGLFITRAVRRWLEKSYLPKTHMDMGVRTSLATGVTYLGALVALLFTCGYLGLSLDKIALFASALSVGIGFGLQSVIGNFVSGLILMAERPVKVGDWIAIGDLEGDIRKINVRATEIEMSDKSKLIVPNSDLISKTVRNVTHGGSLGRVMIVLKVDHNADPSEVRDLLVARVQGHHEILKEPAAGVYLANVKDGALEFNVFAYVATPRAAYRVKSELLFQIVPDLKAKGIALASSSPVVNVGLAERLPEPKPEGTPAKG
jgi:potassium-dependent mechanosensitive channel